MNQPLRVLHVIGGMDRGGAETMIMNLYRSLDKTKIQFDFVVHTNKKCAFDDEISSMGGKIFRVPQFKGTNIKTYQKAWKYFFEKHPEYKVIHGHIGSSAALYLKIAKKYDLFTIAHSHNTMHNNTLKGIVYSIFSYKTRYIADYFFACSNLAGISRYGKKITKSERYKILKNAIDTKKFYFAKSVRDRKRKEFCLEDKLVIGHVGRFQPQKNHEFLIETFYFVQKKHKNAVLLLIGDGDLRSKIEKKVADLGLSDFVIFTGVRTDISELLQAMDIFLFPSLFEGLPVTLIEAQATGLSCAISDTVTKEVKITPNLLTFISLRKSPEQWAKEVLSGDYNLNRENIHFEIEKNGYNINDTAKWIQDFYTNKVALIHN